MPSLKYSTRFFLVVAATSTISVVGSAAIARAAVFELPNSASAACRAVGSCLVFELDSPPSEPQLRFRRLNNVVFDVSWEPRESEASTPSTPSSREDGPYLAPRLVPPERLLTLSQSSDTWTIELADAIRYPARITLHLASPPLHAPTGHVCTSAADGVIVLPARHAMPSGRTLQFEPLAHKNTVGCWVNAADSVQWSFANDTDGTWDIHVLQGCGSGQGGSRVRFDCGAVFLEYVVVETGHFQNFRWKHVGTVDLPRSDRLSLTVSCQKKARDAVMDIRQIRIVPRSPQPTVLSLAQTQPDIVVQPLTTRSPAAGRRVIRRLPGSESSECYHTLSLPTDWHPAGNYPVLAEWAGNGPFASADGDTNSGRVEDACLAHGLAGNDGVIVVGLPFLDDTASRNVSRWWGTPPSHAAAPSTAYAKAAIRDACERFGGDPSRVTLVGFSRGSIACNALGLIDDEMSSLWHAAVCFSHYDGMRRWPFPGSDATAAVSRLKRLHGRRQLIMAETLSAGVAGTPRPDLSSIREFLESTKADGVFTFLETGFRNHDDDWALRPSPARRQARRWLSEVLVLPPRDESL